VNIRNRAAALAFRAVLTLCCLAGLILNFTDWPGGRLTLLSYYTIQSNVVVLVFFAYLLWRGRRPGKRVSPAAKGGVTVCITLTFLVYHFILSPGLSGAALSAYGLSAANTLAHYVTPLMVLADWLLFDSKGAMKPLDPVKWLAIPAAYLVFALVRAQFGQFGDSDSRYPYFFLDVDVYGAGRVTLNCVVIGLGYALLGYVVYTVDRLLPRLGRRLGAGRGAAGDGARAPA
jgi:hypothetical protein